MIRRFLTRWANRHGEDLRDPLDIPDWPEAPDQPATPHIPQEPPADAPPVAWSKIARIDREHTAIRNELAELRASRPGARA